MVWPQDDLKINSPSTAWLKMSFYVLPCPDTCLFMVILLHCSAVWDKASYVYLILITSSESVSYSFVHQQTKDEAEKSDQFLYFLKFFPKPSTISHYLGCLSWIKVRNCLCGSLCGYFCGCLCGCLCICLCGCLCGCLCSCLYSCLCGCLCGCLCSCLLQSSLQLSLWLSLWISLWLSLLFSLQVSLWLSSIFLILEVLVFFYDYFFFLLLW